MQHRISKERMAHMHGVAELMYNCYEGFNCGQLTREQIYLLGLVHDVGYVSDKASHEEIGAELFPKDSVFYECIKWHGNSPQEYTSSKNISAKDVPAELVMLWWADLMIESTGEYAGQIVGIKSRLDSIKARFGEESKEFKTSDNTANWLTENVKYHFSIIDEAS